MIKKSFIFLPGVSYKLEEKIKKSAKDWNQFLINEVDGISKKRKLFFNSLIKKAKKNLLNEEAKYFSKILPKKEHYRLYEYFKDETIFLDIEIRNRQDIIIIGIYDNDMKTMVKGFNLDKNKFKQILNNAKLLVTYNGRSFDIPLIEKYFDMNINIPHIDLKSLCNKVGLKGGLKEIEKKLGIKREDKFRRGGDPIKMWRLWNASRDKDYLNMLIEYNENDVINLKKILEYAIKQI